MKRRLLNLLTVLSLLLCVAVVVLWVRSSTRATSITCSYQETPFRFSTHVLLSSAGRLWYIRSRESGGRRRRWRFEDFEREVDKGLIRPPASFDLAGFSYRRLDSVGGYGWQEWTVPHALLCAVFAAAPGARLVRSLRYRRRRAARLCPSCGYDLRATPGRCPECGQVVEGNARPEHH